MGVYNMQIQTIFKDEDIKKVINYANNKGKHSQTNAMLQEQARKELINRGYDNDSIDKFKRDDCYQALIASLDIRSNDDIYWVNRQKLDSMNLIKNFIGVLNYDKEIKVGNLELGYDIKLDKRIFVKQ